MNYVKELPQNLSQNESPTSSSNPNGTSQLHPNGRTRTQLVKVYTAMMQRAEAVRALFESKLRDLPPEHHECWGACSFSSEDQILGSPSTPVNPKTTMIPPSATRKRKLVLLSPLAAKHPKILSPVPNTPPPTPQSPLIPVPIRLWHFAPNTGSPHATYVAQSPNTPIAMQWQGYTI